MGVENQQVPMKIFELELLNDEEERERRKKEEEEAKRHKGKMISFSLLTFEKC